MKMMSLAIKEAGDSFLVGSITVALTDNGHSHQQSKASCVDGLPEYPRGYTDGAHLLLGASGCYP